MFESYSIQSFIDDRLKELGFRRGELARRCGYANISKGVRRIDRVCGGARPTIRNGSTGFVRRLVSRRLLRPLPIIVFVWFSARFCSGPRFSPGKTGDSLSAKKT